MKTTLKIIELLTIFLLLLSTRSLCLSDLAYIYSKLVNESYRESDNNLIPLEGNDTMVVYVHMGLTAINGYDEVSGSIDVAAYFYLSWRDERLRGRYVWLLSQNITPPTEIIFDCTSVWHPSLHLVNSVDSIEEVGDKAYKVRVVFPLGLATWKPRVILRSSCSANVTFYPFDVQECGFIFTAWDYNMLEIVLRPNYTTVDMKYYEINGEWTVMSTQASHYEDDDKSFLTFSLKIKRNSMYYVINIVLPTILLGLLNGFVFLIPATSGERVGFSITCFLSNVVLLNMIMNLMPRTSAPISLLCYYVTMMMIFSSFISLIAILTLRIYHKADDNVEIPRWLAKITFVLTCKCRKKSNRVKSKDNSNVGSVQGENHTKSAKCGSSSIKMAIAGNRNDVERNRSEHEEQTRSATLAERDHAADAEEDVNPMAWKSFGKLLDCFAFVCFLAGQGLFSFSFLLPLGLSYKNQLG